MQKPRSKGFDDRALRHFDCHSNYFGRGGGAGNQPIAQLLDPRAAMRNARSPKHSPWASTRQT